MTTGEPGALAYVINISERLNFHNNNNNIKIYIKLFETGKGGGLFKLSGTFVWRKITNWGEGFSLTSPPPTFCHPWMELIL